MNREFKIDRRDAAGIRANIGNLASSYTPEWRFDPANPDIGAVIGLIFAHQTEGTVQRLNQALGKYRTEFVNMLSLPLKPAHPARGVVTMDLTRDTVPGTELPMGTKFLGGGEGDLYSLVFESMSDVYITNSRLRDVIAVSPSKGKIIPIMGSVRRPALFGGEQEMPEETEQDFIPFTLFDYEDDSVGRDAVILYHKTIFDADGGAGITIRVTDHNGADLSGALADDKKYKWSFLSPDGLKPFDSVISQGGSLVLRRGHECLKIEEDYSAVVVEAAGPVNTPVEFGSVLLSSSCDNASPDSVLHNTTELEPGRFMPFGDTAALFDECYLGQDALFAQAGARITAEFDVRYRDKTITFTPQQEAENLKVVKLKPKNVVFETAKTMVEKVHLEYFNGLGWRMLPCGDGMSKMFAGTAGPIALSFICPEDWQPLTIGGYHGRCLRIRIEQADNCYLRPCIHTMPEVSGLKLSYRYDGIWKRPQKVRRISGTAEEELQIEEGTAFTAFSPLRYPGDRLYFGFDRKMESGPVGLLFKIEPVRRTGDAALTFEYSTRTGFAPLKVIDHTENLSSTGTLAFIPPPDFAEAEIEGVRRYWLRVSDGKDDEDRNARPRIEDIIINAVEICNVETVPEESFYIDAAQPNMSFPLAARNILSADVYVNERGFHTENEMKRLADEQDVRISHNFMGNISEFFVRWTETEDFSDSGPGDRHYIIDRMTNTIRFGDGVKVMAPRPQTSEAFTVRARCTRGAAGNLPAGAVNSAQGNLLFIGSISNPVDTWGGGDIESSEKAHLRGANVLSSQNRLVSAADFEREVMGASASIRKVRCVTGRTPDGRAVDGAVTIAVMTKDYRGGSYSFAELKDSLKRLLLQKCEAGLREDLLIITEPLYVSISTAVYLQTSLKSFAVRNKVVEHLESFLDPLSRRNGWDIGRLPDEAQIRFELGSGFIPGAVSGFIATARWQDGNSIRECALDALPRNPFMIGVSGGHTVQITER
jgi:hypothetical protein